MFEPTNADLTRLYAELAALVVHGRPIEQLMSDMDEASAAAGFALLDWQRDVLVRFLGAEWVRS